MALTAALRNRLGARGPGTTQLIQPASQIRYPTAQPVRQLPNPAQQVVAPQPAQGAPSQPAQPQVPVTGAVPQGALSAVTPQSTLRGTQISPVTSARTQSAGQAVQSALGQVNQINRPAMSAAQQAQAYGQLSRPAYAGGGAVMPGQARTEIAGGPGISAELDPYTQAARAREEAAAGQLAGADRGQLASQATQAYRGLLAQPNILNRGAINPNEDPRLAAARGRVDAAAAQAAGADRARIAGEARGEFAGALRPDEVRGGVRVGPGGSAREAQYGSMVDSAAGSLTDPLERERRLREEYRNALGPSDLAAGPRVDPEASARLRGAEGQADTAASALSQINRSQIAKDQLRAFDIEDAEAKELRDKATAEKAARFGRLGHGGTENQLYESRRKSELDRQSLGHRLAAETAAGDIEDAFRREQALSGREAQLYGQEAGTRGERRGERDYFTGIGRENLERSREDARTALGLAAEGADRQGAFDFERLGTLADLEEREFGRGLTRRGEERGERDYATGLEERNVDRRNRARELGVELGEARGAAGVGDAFDRLNALRGVEGDVFGEAGAEREELRGERGFATGLDQYNQERDLAAVRDAIGLGESRAGAEIGDRFGRLGAYSDLAGRVYGEGQGLREEGRGERGYRDALEAGNLERTLGQRTREREEERGERGYRDEIARGNEDRDDQRRQFAMQFGAGEAGADISDRFNRFGATSDLYGRERGYDLGEREELRGERSYQDELAREANQGRVNQRLAEEDFFGGDFNRAAQQGAQGFGMDPVQEYLAGAGQYGQEAESAFGDLGEMLRLYGMGQQLEQERAQAPAQQAGGNFAPGEWDWMDLIGILNPGTIR